MGTIDDSSTTFQSNAARTRWEFSAYPAKVVLTFDGTMAVATDRDGRERLRTPDPFAALGWMTKTIRSEPSDSRWLGYISYEFARYIERLPANSRDDLRLPLFRFELCRPRPSSAQLVSWINREGLASSAGRSFTRSEYLAAVGRSMTYIGAGDVFQVNLAQRLSFESARPLGRVWELLGTAQYSAKIEFDGVSIFSNSPELFFRIDPQPDGSRKIVNRPIKGTRPNAPGMFDELSHSAKDRAELAMIVDLQRNDLGRVCEIGSVVVREPRVIEETPTVLHGVATIDGTLRKDATFADVIRALFPCGSITGCPKVRAMEIIDELEPVARGPYCGAIGYLAADGSAEFNVAIRTMVIKDGIAHVCVGGGIVADSSPEAEYEETLVKARAMLAALGVTQPSS